MQTINFKGYKITIFESYLGKDVFINDAKGNQIYAAKMHKFDSVIDRAKMIIKRAN
jgi:hypothetical protein